MHDFFLWLWVGQDPFPWFRAIGSGIFTISLCYSQGRTKKKRRKQISKGHKKQSQDVVLWFCHGFLVYKAGPTSFPENPKIGPTPQISDLASASSYSHSITLAGGTLTPTRQETTPPHLQRDDTNQERSQILKSPLVILLGLCFQVSRTSFVHEKLARQSGDLFRYNSLQIYWLAPLLHMAPSPKTPPELYSKHVSLYS